jgi:hypothetical protein
MTGVEELVARRYRITGPLGSGGLGRVWLAVDEVRHRQVAIKKCSVPDGLTESEQKLVRDWTVREARAVARVRHPNVVRIHDALTGDDQPWIVMEYVPARSLLQLIKEDGVLPAEQVARIGLAVLQALNAAHRVGVLHLDVKPSNVLIADDGRIMLTDFGPAVTDAGIGALNRAGVILGSPNYVAPERLSDGVSTAQADLWSLGATLYHAAEGRPPYARETVAATLEALGGGSPHPPRLAGALTPVLDGLLQRDPAGRMAPAEAEDRLRRVADVQAREHPPSAEQRAAPSEPVSDRVSPAGVTRWVRRRIRGRVAALAAVFAVFALLAVVASDRLPRPTGSERARAEAGAQGRPTTQPAVPSAGPFVLPPHFSWWNDRSGFGMAVPSGWPNRRNGRNAVLFTAPGGHASLRVSTWTPGAENVVTVLIGQERDVKLPGYRRIRIEALPTPGDAVWEYTFRDPEAGPVRALDRIVARGGRTYRVEWHTPIKAWAGELQKLDVVLDSLRPLQGT